MPDTIELSGISHHFDTGRERIELFRGLSCTVRGNETLAITGPSGTGKSSPLSIAAGLERPTGGSVCFTIHGAPADALTLRAHSGFISHQFHLLPELDAIGNLALPLRLKGHRDAFKVAACWLERVGLKDRARHRHRQRWKSQTAWLASKSGGPTRKAGRSGGVPLCPAIRRRIADPDSRAQTPTPHSAGEARSTSLLKGQDPGLCASAA